MSEDQTLPSWDMSNIFPSLDSKEFKKANQTIHNLVDELETYLVEHDIHPEGELVDNDHGLLAAKVKGLIIRSNDLNKRISTVNSYILAFTSTDSYDQLAARALSMIQPTMVKFSQLVDVIFKGWLAKIGDQIDDIIAQDEVLQEHSFYLKETIEQSKFIMSAGEEELAGQLSLSGLHAWTKLQNDIVSQLTWPFEDEAGEIQPIPISDILNLRNHPDERMRRRGYEVELEAIESVAVPLAACLNGIKGAQSVLWKRRGREDAVHEAIHQSRIDRETLEAMLGSVRKSLPLFRKYFKAKARRLGKQSLPWWDLMAPLGKTSRNFSYREAQGFVLENFSKFSEELAEFAHTAYENNWIDVGPQDGKGAGAFCMGVPGVKESRILLNFESNLDWVFTLAHELGHGFHNYCMYERNRSELNSNLPLTLAETASIMCETIVTDAAIILAEDKEEELAILETSLINSSQVVVDIYSRYLFEAEVFSRRQSAELSVEEFNEIMEWAQAETYGDGLDDNYRHKYMWTWKSHYYIPDLAFYNFPYTFGLLFGTGLFTIYQERGSDFVNDYKDLLSSTGMAKAPDLAKRFGMDLRSQDFWDGSIKVIEKQIDRYLHL